MRSTAIYVAVLLMAASAPRASAQGQSRGEGVTVWQATDGADLAVLELSIAGAAGAQDRGRALTDVALRASPRDIAVPNGDPIVNGAQESRRNRERRGPA